MVMDRVEGLAWLRKQVEAADRDLLRELLKAVVESLMGVDADALCGGPLRQSVPPTVPVDGTDLPRFEVAEGVAKKQRGTG